MIATQKSSASLYYILSYHRKFSPLLISKLEAYGLSITSQRNIRSYLNQRLQRTGVSIVLVYGKTLLLVYHRDQYLAHFYLIYILRTFIFIDTAFVGNYADDTTLESIQNNPKSNQAIPSYNHLTLQKWFYENYMVLNPSKCFYMWLGSKIKTNDFIL